jgi:hypothetical protein
LVEVLTDAVEGRAIVVVATSSPVPVIENHLVVNPVS